MTNKLRWINKKIDYNDWANAMWNNSFNFSTKEICSLLNVSMSWINHQLLKEIPYVVYEPKYMWKFHKIKNSLTYVRKEDVIDYLIKKGTFEQQTEIVELYSYLFAVNKKKADEILKQYRSEINKKEGFIIPGTIPVKVLKEINKNFISNIGIKNLNCSERKNVPWIKKDIKEINIKNIYFIEDRTPELVYRNAFNKGDIKLTLGNKKTIFIKNNYPIDKFKMPFRIKCDKKLLIQNSKK